MNKYDMYVGQLVTTKTRGNTVYKVVKINPKKVKVVDEKGSMLVGPPAIWDAAPPGVSFDTQTPSLVPGMIVEAGGKYAGFYTVYKVSTDLVNCHKLGGGARGSYYRFPPSKLEVVEIGDLVDKLEKTL